ncbi:MAG: imidazole glycerol phosphate synthase subunit HisF [Peptococcaceae bacterium]|nr:imidazole glycerol phosphate synthase subunit HisF [Peptococcaceae bacterium]
MLAKRIIPCLDVRDGKVVKGINFVGIKEVGDPVALAKQYSDSGADEIVFLDITASHEGRGTMLDVVRRTAEVVFVPLTVGGGIRTIDDIRETLRAGSDKVGINSAAVRTPELINEAAEIFGRQCIVAAVDAKLADDGSWHVVINGGRIDTGKELISWVKELEARGAGEILLTSMDADGTKAGYDLAMTKAVCAAVNIPVIASGGAGSVDDFANVFEETDCDAALAASLFHYGELTIDEVKDAMRARHIPAR